MPKSRGRKPKRRPSPPRMLTVTPGPPPSPWPPSPWPPENPVRPYALKRAERLARRLAGDNPPPLELGFNPPTDPLVIACLLLVGGYVSKTNGGSNE